MNLNKGSNADEPNHEDGKRGDCGIGRHGACPWSESASHQTNREAMLKNKEVSRTNAKHYYRISVETIADTGPVRECCVLSYCECSDVANSSAIKIPKTRV